MVLNDNIKRSLIIAVFLAASLFSFAGNYPIRNIGFSYGGVFYPGQYANQFEVSYENYFKSCITRSPYYSVGLHLNSHPLGNEYGMSVAVNPTRLGLPISRRSMLMPYLFYQGNLVDKKSSEENILYYNSIPGVGGVFLHRTKSRLSFRVATNIGYRFGETLTETNSNFCLEVKVGIAFNLSFIKKKYRKKVNG